MKALLRRRWKRLLLIGLVIGLLITPIVVVTRTWLIIHPDKRPSATMGRPVVEKQTESFTCGYHALSMLYRAYGLDPEQEHLRWRLGVDTKALFWKSDTTGALHPDMFMVLGQDHFRVDALDPSRSDAWSNLVSSVKTGCVAVLLISRRENGHLHWVIGSWHDDNRIEVFDSLRETPYFEDKSLLDGHIVSAIIVSPDSVDRSQRKSSVDLHLQGVTEMRKVPQRLAQLKDGRT